MQKVYFISGLGADKRVFSYLDLRFCEPVFIDWISPVANESLQAYALRLRSLMDDEHPIIVGLSLGGMIAAEIAATDEKIKAIIISSGRDSRELPVTVRLFKYLPVYKWVPGYLLKNMQRLYTYAFGVKDKEHKKILYQVIHDADMPFVKWAMGAIVHWRYQQAPGNIIHIHGTADRLFRIGKLKPDHRIKGGTHVMTLDKHEEVSALLKNLIVGQD